MLKEVQAPQALLEAQAAARLKEMAIQVDEMHARMLAHAKTVYGEHSSAGFGLFVDAMWFLDPSVRREIINAAKLDADIKAALHHIASILGEQHHATSTFRPLLGPLPDGGGAIAHGQPPVTA
ncbi:MAG TPA: hypothetical protein VGC99_07130 [Candidatus Tectomicrobia bacterium]